MSSVNVKTASSQEVMSTLQWMRSKNIKPVPVHYSSKAAISRDYAQPGYVPPDDSVWRNTRLNVGALLGPANGGPVDIDLDCPEAIFFAPKFLPPTAAIYGRKSKPSSHYLYKVSAPSMAKVAFFDPKIMGKKTEENEQTAMIIEIRADGGHQSVFPGSIHEGSRETIAWTSVPFPEIPVVDPDELIAAVKNIVIAVLIVRHMWFEGQRNEVAKHLSGMFYYLDWTEEQAAAMIAAIQDYTGDDDKTRQITVRSTYAKAAAGSRVTGAPSLRKFLNEEKVVDKIMELAGAPSINLIQEYNDRFAVVDFEGKYRIAGFPKFASEPPTFYSPDDFMGLNCTDTFVNADGKTKSKAAVWLSSPRRRTYDRVEFCPGEIDPPHTLNLWSGWGLQPSSEGSCEAILELWRDVICGGSEELFNWVMHWFANIIREPMKKSLTSLVIIGKQGSGKSLSVGYFGKILGRGYTVVTKDDHITGRFNRHLGTTLLLHSEEALFGGDKKHRGIIKSLITDEYNMIEPKGVDAKRVKNHLRLVLTSNEAHAAPAESNDRRFTIIDMQKRKASEELITRVVHELENGGPEALFQYMLDMPYDRNIPRVNLKTQDLTIMKSINYTPMEAWWQDSLMFGCVLPDCLSWAQKPSEDPWPQIVGSRALYMSLVMRMRELGQRNIPNEALFASQLNKFLGVHLHRKTSRFVNPQLDEYPQVVKMMSGMQNAITNMPSLQQCRDAFEKHVGHEIEWPEAEDPATVPAHEKKPTKY